MRLIKWLEMSHVVLHHDAVLNNGSTNFEKSFRTMPSMETLSHSALHKFEKSISDEKDIEGQHWNSASSTSGMSKWKQ